MMGVSQEPEDKRTLQEKLEEIQKKFPIDSYWYENVPVDDNRREFHKVYHWVYGYEMSEKDSKNISIKTQIVEFSNEGWFMRRRTSFTIYNPVVSCEKDDFLKFEKKIKKGFDNIRAIIDVNKLHNTWHYPKKELSELKSGDKFIYFLNDGSVIRFGEMKDEFKASNGKWDDTYNSIMRHLSYGCKYDEEYFTIVGKMSNWNLNDKMTDYFVIDDEYFNTLNEIFDDITFSYNSTMLCDTYEEKFNFLRKIKLDKILD